MLLNLLRGAGLDGLAGMRSARRPLLGLRRSETRALCEDLGLRPVDDPSNAVARLPPQPGAPRAPPPARRHRRARRRPGPRPPGRGAARRGRPPRRARGRPRPHRRRVPSRPLRWRWPAGPCGVGWPASTLRTRRPSSGSWPSPAASAGRARSRPACGSSAASNASTSCPVRSTGGTWVTSPVRGPRPLDRSSARGPARQGPDLRRGAARPHRASSGGRSRRTTRGARRSSSPC